MIETIQLLPGITLRCYPDTRFRQGCLSLQFVAPMGRETAAVNALLPAVLLRGTKNHPDLRSITLRLDELYGASVGTLVRRAGDYQTTGFYCSFIEDRYAMAGDRVLEPMVEFLGELLRQPLTENGAFCRDYVEGEKKNLISTIESELNDKRVYAMNRLMSAMCASDSYGIPRLGEKEQVAAITAGFAWEHYQALLSHAPVELFYVGSAPARQVAALLTELFRPIRRDVLPLPAQTPFRDAGGGQTVTERMDVTQAKLCMGFTTPITNRSEQFAAMQVANTVYGAGMTSKLFQNVRERLSLCYSIGSSYYGAKGIVAVSAGIDPDKVELTRREILEQLDACRRGDITREELTAAKEALRSTLRASADSPGAIEGYYATAALSGLNRTPEQYAREVEAVTLEQAAAAAATVTLHTTYILRGVEE